MLDQGLAYYMPYESFNFLELLFSIALRHSPQVYEVKSYKEQKEGESDSKYKANIFLEYSPKSIAFTVPTDWSFHVKKIIDPKREKAEFYQNKGDMLDWIDERFKGKTIKLLQIYYITSFKKS